MSNYKRYTYNGPQKVFTPEEVKAQGINGFNIKRGTKVNAWTYIYSGTVREGSREGHAYFMCECGKIREERIYRVLNGSNRSCGCLGYKGSTHGDSKKPYFKAWYLMNQRCTNPTRGDYEYFGGKGITVYPEWEDSFESFKAWSLDNGYKKDKVLSRKDKAKDFNPDNCQWVSKQAHARTAGRKRFLTYKGETKELYKWADDFNISRITLAWRVRNGWTVEEALETKVGEKKGNK